MDVEERIRRCLLLQEMDQNRHIARKMGLRDVSYNRNLVVGDTENNNTMVKVNNNQTKEELLWQ